MQRKTTIIYFTSVTIAIISADNPWGPNFDATMIYGPVHGAVFYIGVRVNWNKI